MEINGNTVISVSLSLDKINVILGSLSKLPYDTVAGLIAEIQQQAQMQLVALQQPAPAPASEAANDQPNPEAA